MAQIIIPFKITRLISSILQDSEALAEDVDDGAQPSTSAPITLSKGNIKI